VSAEWKGKTVLDSYLVRALAKESGIRGIACLTTSLVREAAQRHRATPAGTAALGYGLTAAALLGALLKVQQQIALKVEGDGPLGKMVVESDSYGHVRGYLEEPALLLPLPIGPNELAAAIGRQGRLTVAKDLDTDLTYYLMMSEQVPSVVEIGAPVDGTGQLVAAGGLLLQLLPGGDLALLQTMAEELDDLPPLGEMLARGTTPEQLLACLFGGQRYEVLETGQLMFRCTCSRERSRQALRLLEPSDLCELMAEGEAVIDCHFCQEQYRFDQNELQQLIEEQEQAG
jgi:molecular chaperone Hsp33